MEDAMILEGVPNYCIRRTVRRGWLGGTTSHGAPPPPAPPGVVATATPPALPVPSATAIGSHCHLAQAQPRQD